MEKILIITHTNSGHCFSVIQTTAATEYVFLTLLCYHETRCQKPGGIVWCSLNLLHQRSEKCAVIFQISSTKLNQCFQNLSLELTSILFFSIALLQLVQKATVQLLTGFPDPITSPNRGFSLKAEFKTLILWFVCRRTRVNEAAERSEGHRHNLQRSEIWLHPLSEQTADTLLFIDAKHLQYDLLMCVIKLLLFFGGVCVSSFRWGHRVLAWDFAHVWLRVWLMHFERCN